MNKATRILVIRNDKLGDFMLAWPALSLLKSGCPDAQICVLVPEYTEPMARICPWIDDVIVDAVRESTLSDARQLARSFRGRGLAVSISLYTETRTALATLLAGIPVRIGPATKVAQLFHNHRVTQRRSRSEKPEHVYNTDLARYYVQLVRRMDADPVDPPYLEFDRQMIERRRRQFVEAHGAGDRVLVYIHPGSGGSADNLSLEQYARLAVSVAEQARCFFVITAGPREAEIAHRLSALITDLPHAVYHSRDGLVEFSRQIACADIFISGSTGPLHIAGALNRRTVAFYPARRSATSLRWQTLNTEANRIAIMPGAQRPESGMSQIDLTSVAAHIRTKFLG